MSCPTRTPFAPRGLVAYAVFLFVVLGSVNQGALAAPVRPTLPLALPREEHSNTNTTVLALPVPHKNNHGPLGSMPTLPALEVHVPEVHLPESHLPAPAVSTLPAVPTLPAANTTTTHHSDDAFQVGNVHVQAQVKTPTNATEEQKKAALVEALRGAVGMLQQSQNATTKEALQKRDDRVLQKNATMEGIAKILKGENVPTGIDQHTHTVGVRTTIDGRMTIDGLGTLNSKATTATTDEKERKLSPKEELERKMAWERIPKVLQIKGRKEDNDVTTKEQTNIGGKVTTLNKKDKEQKRKEKDDAKQQKATGEPLDVWKNLNPIKDSLSKRADAASPAPDFAKKVALLQDALGKPSAVDTANTANSTDTMADSTLGNLTSLNNLPDTTMDTADRTNAAATDAKSAIMQLAAAANKVRNSKKKDEVMKAVAAVKAVAAAAEGDLELQFWKKVIGVLDDIFG